MYQRTERQKITRRGLSLQNPFGALCKHSGSRGSSVFVFKIESSHSPKCPLLSLSRHRRTISFFRENRSLMLFFIRKRRTVTTFFAYLLFTRRLLKMSHKFFHRFKSYISIKAHAHIHAKESFSNERTVRQNSTTRRATFSQ